MLHKNRHIPLIRADEKTVTRRIWKEAKARPRPGSIHMAAAPCMLPDDADRNSAMFLRTEECTCFVQIGMGYAGKDDREPLGAMTNEDAQKEGDYETVAEFRETWVDLHGEWDPEQVVDVIPYAYVGRSKPTCPCCGSHEFNWIRAHGDTICHDCGWYTEDGGPSEPPRWPVVADRYRRRTCR